MIHILIRNIKWRFQNPISIIITILQPLLWLILYSAIADQAMDGIGITNYTAFILPGIMVLVTFSACSSGGFLNFIMKSSGSFYRILISPVSRSSIILAQVLEAVILSFIEIIILFMVSLFFSVHISSGFMGLLLIILLIATTGFFVANIAYYISLCMPNEVIYETLMSSLILPVFFLSSALFPMEKLTGIIRIIVTINPFTHVINAIRNLILIDTIKLNEIGIVLLIFITLDLLSFLLSKSKLRKQMI